MPIYVHGFIWALVGLVLPFLWGLSDLVFMHSRSPAFSSDLYWNFLYVTYPTLLLPESSVILQIRPYLNACLYGGVAVAIIGTQRWLKGRRASGLR